MSGLPRPGVRSDIIDVYVVRRAGNGLHVLQLRRARAPMIGTWHPVMGHIEPGERATEAAARELREELALDVQDAAVCRELLALGGVHPFFVAEWDSVVLSPRFVVLVDKRFEPRLNGEHDAHRWVSLRGVGKMFLWPGQRAAITEAAGLLLDKHRAEARAALRIDPATLRRP